MHNVSVFRPDGLPHAGTARFLHTLLSARGGFVAYDLLVLNMWGDRPPRYPEVRLSGYAGHVSGVIGWGIRRTKGFGMRFDPANDKRWKISEDELVARLRATLPEDIVKRWYTEV